MSAQYQREIREGARNLVKFERAWERYIEALRAQSDAAGHPDGRTRYAKRRQVRAASRNLDRVCAAIGVESPR